VPGAGRWALGSNRQGCQQNFIFGQVVGNKI